MSDCQQCGMWVDPKKPYHPYAACLMFMGCKNGNTVQANLDGVVAHGDRYAALEARCQRFEAALRKIENNDMRYDLTACAQIAREALETTVNDCGLSDQETK